MYDEKNTYYMIGEVTKFDKDSKDLSVRTCYTNFPNSKPWASALLHGLFSEKYLRNKESINKLNVGALVIVEMVIIEGSVAETNKGIKFDVKRIKFL